MILFRATRAVPRLMHNFRADKLLSRMRLFFTATSWLDLFQRLATCGAIVTSVTRSRVREARVMTFTALMGLTVATILISLDAMMVRIWTWAADSAIRRGCWRGRVCVCLLLISPMTVWKSKRAIRAVWRRAWNHRWWCGRGIFVVALFLQNVIQFRGPVEKLN